VKYWTLIALPFTIDLVRRANSYVAVLLLLLPLSTGCGPDTESEQAIRRTAVSSSALRSVGYDAAARVLEIEFHNGDVYQYFEVPPEVYEELMASDSLGRYFHRKVRSGQFRYRKMLQ
jgi:hypothetical protein